MEKTKNRIEELKSINGLENRDRYFKVGDVIRYTGPGCTIPQIRSRGLGVVVSSSGPLFDTYWVGDGIVRSADARGGGHSLQDFAPIPQVAEWLENIS